MNRSSIINIWGFLLLTTLLYGCSGETPESLTPSSEDAMRIPMSFQIYSARNTTQSRANTDYYIDGTERKTLPAGSSLGVFAYYTNKKTWSEAKSSIEPNFMNDQEMKVMASVGQNGVSLSYNPTRYWPNDDNQKITFSGYYPFASEKDNHGISIIEGGLNNFKPALNFRVKNNSAEQIDLLLSDVLNDRTRSDATHPLVLKLNHTLCQIVVKIKLSDEYKNENVKLTGRNWKIKGVYNTGNVYMDCTNPHAQVVKWQDRSYSTGNYTTWRYEAHPTDNAHGDTTTSNNDVLLLIPQTVTSHAVIRIGYDLKFFADDHTTELYHYDNNTTEIDLNKAGITEWKPGMRYTYTFVVGLNEIKIDATTTNWLEETINYDENFNN